MEKRQGGSMGNLLELSPSRFFAAWVSSLVTKGETCLEPDRPETRRALNAVRALLNTEAKKSEEHGDIEIESVLLDLCNQFLPSNSGAFDGVERALRNLQTSLVMSPNPDHVAMIFEVPKRFADGVTSSLSPAELRLVEDAARTYVNKKQTVDKVALIDS